MSFEKQNRPGGELYGRPSQDADGKWRNQYGEELSEEESRDLEYATRFWESQPSGMREAMRENIEIAAQAGSISSFVDPKGISEKDKEKLSAYRVLAKEMGYEVGQYVTNRDSYTAVAPINKK